MYLKFKIVLVLFLVFSAFSAEAQQDPQYTNYMFNTLSVNSAYAGSRGHLTVVGLHRTQWVGIDGAPQTQSLTIESPIGNNLGLGLAFVHDKLGPSRELYLDANLSYTIRLNNESRLSFGLKGGGRLLNVDLFDGFQNNPDVGSINNKFLPTFGAGLYWRNDKSYIGISVPNFLTNKHFDRDTFSSTNFDVSAERLHYFFIAGKVFDLSDNVKFKPAFLGKFVVGAPAIVDISANFLIYEKLRLGAAYRWDDSFSGLLGLQLTPKLLLGYAYDLTTTRLGDFNSGTHEIMLRFELKTKEKQLKSPRFF
ncbi:PorP/SprF family type IX secretion system membrane protein [Tenacibaculum jejuense]|uniref:Putative membrane protein n=1 Tax=Tenacibaculum jejuense TaxID=584609 RepID=A0A238U8E7_9FLAO|nr:type IX secretion system membrane protein PorP/SprF [Tenacibaculum jejuense]SNR15461.1 putative membrane protein [Tenacibaculum jejuense]